MRVLFTTIFIRDSYYFILVLINKVQIKI